MDEDRQGRGGKAVEKNRIEKRDRHGSASPAQVTRQSLIQRRGRGDQLIVDGAVVALLAHLGDKFPDHLAVDLSDRFGIGDDAQIRLFQIFEQNIAVEGQLQLRRVQKMKYDHVIALEAKQAETFEDRLGLVQKIRDQNDQPAPPDLAGDFFEDLADVGFAGGSAVLQRVEDLRQIVALGLGRDERLYAIGERHHAGGVLLLQNQVGEGGDQRAAVVKLGYAVGGVVHGCARVEQEVGAQVGLVFVLLDEITVELSQRLPVDAPDLVARRILAVLLELHAESFGAAAVDARHDPFHPPARAQVEIGNTGEHFWVEVVFIAVGHGLARFRVSGFPSRVQIEIQYANERLLQWEESASGWINFYHHRLR